MMNLEWYNQNTFEEVVDALNKDKRAAVVNACGVGKSSVAIKTIQWVDDPEHTLVLAPASSLLDQFRGYDEFPESVNTYSYQMLMYAWKMGNGSLSADERFNKKWKLIICDEMHRMGADIWGEALKCLRNDAEDAYWIGLTATPFRTDTGINMVDEWFNGNSCGNIDLKKAINMNILPIPTYVTAIYDVRVEIDARKRKIDSMRQYLNQSEVEKLSDILKQYEIMWQENSTLLDIIKKWISPIVNSNSSSKFLIFCSNSEQMFELRVMIDTSLRNEFVNREFDSFEYTSKNCNEEHIAQKFDDFLHKQHENSVVFCWVLDMFNEGLHVDDLDGIIMLRQTESRRIYEQQLGRVLSRNRAHEHPLVLDMVNNCRSANMAKEFWGSIIPSSRNQNITSKSNGDNKGAAEVLFYDETMELQELLDMFDSSLVELNSKYAPKLYDVFDMKGVTIYDVAHRFCCQQNELLLDVESGMTLEESVNKYVITVEVPGEGPVTMSKKWFCNKYGKSIAFVTREHDVLGRTYEDIFLSKSDVRKNVRSWVYNGKSMSLSKLCYELNLDKQMANRVAKKYEQNNDGKQCDIEYLKKNVLPMYVEWGDKKLTILDLCIQLKIEGKYIMVRKMLKQGMDINEIISIVKK